MPTAAAAIQPAAAAEAPPARVQRERRQAGQHHAELEVARPEDAAEAVGQAVSSTLHIGRR
jgi:hypothetical protein